MFYIWASMNSILQSICSKLASYPVEYRIFLIANEQLYNNVQFNINYAQTPKVAVAM